MKYILFIIMTGGYGKGFYMQEFNGKQACESAIHIIKNDRVYQWVKETRFICIEKGAE